MSIELTVPRSIEHNDVEIVAVNDPFIEPHYAVSNPESYTMAEATDNITLQPSLW